jgi:NAD(P)-dependent dehydrogenase (short-subunit alcohol dehydrogenase family)
MSYFNAPELAGRSIVVTGGAGSIGREIGRAAISAKMKVALIDVRKDSLNDAVEELSAAGGDVTGYLLDLTVEEDIVKTLGQIEKEFGKLEVLVNNAMYHDSNDLLGTSLEIWNKTLAVNLTAPFLCIRQVLPGMIKNHFGSIINIGTVNARVMIGSDSYSASKGGLSVLTRTVAVRYGGSGIRCNTIMPGTVATDAWKERVIRNPDIFEDLKTWYPLRRVGKPSDIAAAVLFLASDQSSWTTGSEFVVDGGLLSGMTPMFQIVEGWE